MNVEVSVIDIIVELLTYYEGLSIHLSDSDFSVVPSPYQYFEREQEYITLFERYGLTGRITYNESSFDAYCKSLYYHSHNARIRHHFRPRKNRRFRLC